MWQYVVKQIFQRIFILFVISFLAFIILGQMADPVEILKTQNPHITQVEINEYKIRQGLNKPPVIRYFYWLKNVVMHGDFGTSRQYYIPNMRLLFQRIPNSIYLNAIIFLVVLIIALPLGVFSAIKQYSTFDYVFTFLAFTGAAIPGFWFGLLLILAFGVFPKPGYRLPFTGMYSDTINYGGKIFSYASAPGFAQFLDRLKHLILPVMTGSIHLAGLTRFTRSAFLEVIRQDYIRTARAKGLPENKVIFTHALRNAMIPMATILIQSIPGLFGGSVILEQIFGWPGIGKLTYEALMANDYTLSMAAIIFFSTLTVLFTLIADISYAFLDPRITYR